MQDRDLASLARHSTQNLKEQIRGDFRRQRATDNRELLELVA